MLKAIAEEGLVKEISGKAKLHNRSVWTSTAQDDGIMSEVNYRRNGMKYSTTGKCWGMAPKAGGFASDRPATGPKPKSSRERRAAKKCGK